MYLSHKNSRFALTIFMDEEASRALTQLTSAVMSQSPIASLTRRWTRTGFPRFSLGARLPVLRFFFFIRFWSCGQPVGQLGRSQNSSRAGSR